MKTPPRPASLTLPATSGFSARPRPGMAVLSWRPPSPGQQETFGKPLGYRLTVHSLPSGCAGCPPSGERRIDLPPEGGGLTGEGGKLYYSLPLPEGGPLLRLRMRTEFDGGIGPPSKVLLVEPAQGIPAPELQWSWANPAAGGMAKGGVSKGPRAVLFTWNGVLDRFQWVTGGEDGQRERKLYYRANLYRRVPPRPWPLSPLHPEPLAGTRWVLPPLEASLPASAREEEYLLRFVSSTGSEGPPSTPARISIPARGP